jgi:hypothetical protein
MTQRPVFVLLVGVCLLAVTAAGVGARQTVGSRTSVLVANKGRAEAVPVSVQDEAVGVRVVGPPLRIAIAQTEQPVLVSVVPGRSQWEYTEIKFAVGESPVPALTAAAAQGWEATGITYVVSGRNAVLVRRLRN